MASMFPQSQAWRRPKLRVAEYVGLPIMSGLTRILMTSKMSISSSRVQSGDSPGRRMACDFTRQETALPACSQLPGFTSSEKERG